MGMPRFGSFYDLLFLLVLEAIPFHLPGDPHAQLKSGDEGGQGSFLSQFILQIRQLQQGLLVLLDQLLFDFSVCLIQFFPGF